MKSPGGFAGGTHQGAAYVFRIIKDFLGASETPDLKKILAKPSRASLQENYSSTGVLGHERPRFCISFSYTNTFWKARVSSPEIIKGKIKNQKYSISPANPGDDWLCAKLFPGETPPLAKEKTSNHSCLHRIVYY